MSVTKTIGVVAALACVVSASSAARASSQTGNAAPALAGGTYTNAQAERGLAVYADHCLTCHGENLETARGGTEYGIPSPPLAGELFMRRWEGKGLDELFGFIQTMMPKNSAQRLRPEQYADVLAFLLRENGWREGDAELPADPLRVKGITITAAGPAR